MSENERDHIVLHLRLSRPLNRRLEEAAAVRRISVEQLASEAIQSAFPIALRQPNAAHGEATEFFRWKNVSLPEGTLLYFNHQGTKHMAAIVGATFTHEGKATSPSEFVNKISGATRNAWRDIWIKRPNDSSWVAAQDLRREVTRAELDDISNGGTIATLAAASAIPIAGAIGAVGATVGVYGLFGHRRRFGSLPISEKMGPRYLAACRAVPRIIKALSVSDGDLDHISEAKGMFNRVVREDRHDWQDVQRILDIAGKQDCKVAASWLTNLRLLAKEGDTISDHCATPIAEKVARALASARDELERRFAKR
jgi:hypothetical protein